MDQLIYSYLSHTHYWLEVGKLKVPAIPTLHRILHTPGDTYLTSFIVVSPPFTTNIITVEWVSASMVAVIR